MEELTDNNAYDSKLNMEFPKFNQRIVELVQSGVITLDVHLARDGYSVVAHTTKPHPRIGVLASTPYSVEEIIHVLSKVKIGKDVVPTSPGELKKKSPKTVSFTTAVPTSVTRHGIKNELPHNSLCFADFTLTPSNFALRAKHVARVIGETKAVSRITTDKNLEVRGARNIQEWWHGGDILQKWILLTTSRKVGNPPSGCSYYKLNANSLTYISSLDCPFQDARTEIHSSFDHEKNVPIGDSDSEEEDSGVGYD